MKVLTNEQIAEFLQLEPEWKLVNGGLSREWVFADFVAAMSFVGRVAELAEARGHHPDIDIRYNRVRLGLVTHDAGGVTELDSAMARELSERQG